MNAIRQRLLAKMADLPEFMGNRKMGVAVSGGCDSVALLFLLVHLCRMKKIEICIFHVDHKLRPHSAKDAMWVAQLADELGIKFYSCEANSEDFAAIRKSRGVEAWAREFRYRSFAALCDEAGVEILATGHTADDQLETVLMKLFSGTSIKGFAGIQAFSQMEVAGKKIGLWRPMLKISREELEKYLKSEKKSWLEDETNAHTDFLRNKIRHELIPKISEIFGRPGEKLTCLLEDLRGVSRHIENEAKEYLRKNLVQNRLKLEEQPEILMAEIVHQWLLKLNLARNVSRSLVKRIVDLWKTNVTYRKVDHRNYSFVKRRGEIVFLTGKDT
ncbi:MAG: hypothetical protein Kow0029_13890 [Candidatus Rifleibacteriota bacterium]